MFARKWLILGAALLAMFAGGLKVLLPAQAASQITVNVTLSRSFVPADGATAVSVSAKVLAGTTTQAFRQIRWGILPASAASFSGTPPTDTGLFDNASATVVAGNAPGRAQIVVTDTQTGQVGIATLNQYGRSSHLSISLSQPQVTADGASTVLATATATDSAGVGVPVDTVGFSATPGANGGSVRIGAVTNNGDGTYAATITAGTRADLMTITATDASSTPASTTASTTLAEVPGPPAAVAIALDHSTLPSDGAATATATATVTDAFGNRRGADTVAFHTDGHANVGATVNNMDGTYTSTIRSSTVADVEHITAADLTVTSPQATLTVTPGAAASITMALGRSTIVTNANPADSTTATVTLTDVHGNPVPHETVTITTNGHAHMGAVADHGDGTYVATVTAAAPGPETITGADATIRNADNTVHTVTAALTEQGPPATVTLSLNPTHIHIGTANSSMATAGVFDVAGDPVPGTTVTFGSSSGELNFSNSGTGTTDATGTAHVQVNGVANAGPQTVYVSAANRTASAVLTEYDHPTAMTLALSQGIITADGTTTTLATVTVVDGGGNGIPGQTITLGRTATAAVVDPMSDNGDGTYTFMVHSSKVAQTETLTAGDASYHLTATASLSEVAGTPATVTVTPNPASMTADGHATKVFTATVTDANGNPESGQSVHFASSGHSTFGTVTAAGGTYTATATAGTVAGAETVTVTDTTPATAISGTAALTMVPGAPTQLVVTPGAAGLVADGHSTTVIGVHIEDANANGVYGEHLAVTQAVATGSTGAADLGLAVADTGAGNYTVTVTASTTANRETVAVADGALSGSALITETAGPATHVAVTGAASSISTDQTTGVAFTATVTDVNGNPVPGDAMQFAGTGGLAFGAVTANGDGTYTATATPATAAGVKTITATDGTVTGPVVSGQATLTETAGAPTGLTLAQSSGRITANGTSTMTLAAAVTDRNHNGVPGQTLGVTSAVAGGGTPGITSAVADNGDGTYTVTLTSGKKADVETVTVTDAAIGSATATPATTASATITQVAGPPVGVAVTLLANSTVTANGSDQRTVTVSVTDANGNPVPGEAVSLATSGAATLGSASLTTAADGTASTLVTASTVAGRETITATDASTNVQGAATLTENPGPAASIAVSVPSHNLADDGRSTVVVSALVKDANGNPIPTEQVRFSVAGSLMTVSAATAAADSTGTATTTARSRTTSGTETITATDVADNAINGSVTITLADPDNVATFVKAAYQTLLGRNVDADGLAYWSGQIRGGMSRTTFASTISGSSEFRSDVVSAMYRPYLHRASDSAGVAYWAGQIGKGATFEQVRLSFIGSQEYYQIHGSNAKGAVDALYLDVLGRPVDSGGEQYWVQQLNAGKLTFSQLAASILYSEEGRERLVGGYYQTILNRTGASGDLAYWAGQLQNGTRDEAIINLFVGSSEYYTAH